MSFHSTFKNVQEKSEDIPESSRHRTSYRTASRNVQGKSDDIPKSTKISNCKMKADPGVYFEHWVVLTSIQSPSNIVRDLANIKGWKLLVVGDTKTPRNWR